MLVLDEATSSVDTETEGLIQDALKVLLRDRTAIVIAHRLSTIQSVDEILVMHKGRVRERGRHAELLAQRGHVLEALPAPVQGPGGRRRRRPRRPEATYFFAGAVPPRARKSQAIVLSARTPSGSTASSRSKSSVWIMAVMPFAWLRTPIFT